MLARNKSLTAHTTNESSYSDYADEQAQSGVTLAAKQSAKTLNGDAMIKPLIEEVTLVVYGWTSVEPGTLAWVFPSLGAAVAAAHAMRNAVRWAIVRGPRGETDVDVEEERERGSVLVEQFE
jgi:hypothetical protein